MNATALDPRIREQFNARAPFKLEDATLVVLALVGSHSHNTFIPKDDGGISDMDYMGVVIPPIEYTLGLREWESLSFIHEEIDCTFYSFKKFIGLLMKSNPNVIGLLWMQPEHFIVTSRQWSMLLNYRRAFSSKRAYPAFMGYAYSQLKKMESFDLETQELWERSIAIIEAAGFTKEDVINKKPLGMPNYDALLKSKLVDISGYTVDVDRQAFYKKVCNNHLYFAEKSILDIHARHFQGYMGEKRKNLVRLHGYDTKNAAHLIRLMKMCVEFMKTHELQVFRTGDAGYIKDIKKGKFPLEEIKEKAEQLFRRAEEAKNASSLPEEPNFDLANVLSVNAYQAAYQSRL